MKTSEVLERALALIPDEQHWTQGRWMGGPFWRRRHCLVDALGRASAFQPLKVKRRAQIYVASACGEPRLSAYNDAPGRKYADVRRVLEQAIAHAQAEESDA